HHDVGEVAESRGDAVDDRAAGDGPVHDGPRADDTLAGQGGDPDRAALPGDVFEPGERKTFAVEEERLGVSREAHGGESQSRGHYSTAMFFAVSRLRALWIATRMRFPR